MFKLRILFSSFIGNVLEFYDFILCAFMIPQLAPLFFPSIHPLSSLLAGMSAYAIGFLMRPIGSVIFGHIGDKWGRKRALTISILGMAFSTFLFALLPTYEQIGISAGICFVGLRLCQGLCLGGEVVGAALFCLEHHSEKHRGLMGGILASGVMLGAFLANIVSYFLTSIKQGWRVSFLLGVLTALVGFYIRKRLPETLEYLEYKKFLQIQKACTYFPLLEGFKKNPYAFLAVFSYASLTGALASTIMVFLNIYYTHNLGFTSAYALKLTSIGTGIAIFLHPLIGFATDRIGIRKSIIFFCLFTAFMALPAYIFLATTTHFFILFGMLLIVISYSGMSAMGFTFSMNCFPIQYRYSGTAVSYNIAQSILGGGTQPLISLFLIRVTGSNLAPAFYLIILSIFCLFVVSCTKTLKITNHKTF